MVAAQLFVPDLRKNILTINLFSNINLSHVFWDINFWYSHYFANSG